MSCGVHVLAKPPIGGRAKTRLEGLLGRNGCARLARMQLDRTLALATGAGVGPVTLWMAGGAWYPEVRRQARRRGARLALQRGADLGERMDRVVRRGLRETDGVILVGTDCPGLEKADLALAQEALESGRDAVLGPARDGGYYLLGLKRPAPALFRAMPWGGPGVLAKTLRRMRTMGLDVRMLAWRDDLDRPEDLAGTSPFLAARGAQRLV